MKTVQENFEMELICVIVNFGMGSKILNRAKSCGIFGGTITLGRGMIKNKVLNYLGFSDARKEVLYMVSKKHSADLLLEKISDDYNLRKVNKGIAFTTSICLTMGSSMCKCVENYSERGEESNMHKLITVIVDKGKAEAVIEAAIKGGSKGGTILNARGSGIHETSKLFMMEIEPEKEIALIISETEMAEAIITSIREDIGIDEPGNGIIYVQNINRVYGLHK